MIKYVFKNIFLILPILITLFDSTVSSQNQSSYKDGIIITEKGDITIYYDEFTGKHAITVNDNTLFSSLNESNDDRPNSYVIPVYVYGGNIYDKALADLTGVTEWDKEFNFLLMRENSENIFFSEEGHKTIPFLIDNQRLPKSGYYLKKSSKELLKVTFSLPEWKNIIRSGSSKYRVNGRVFTIDQNTKDLMEKILQEYENIQTEYNIENQTTARTSPYELSWEGETHRSPMVQSLPDNSSNSEAVITVRFEVHPDGTVGRIISLRKMNPELEREVMSTLRTWRFSRLPSGVPQQPQWATITFRFLIN